MRIQDHRTTENKTKVKIELKNDRNKWYDIRHDYNISIIFYTTVYIDVFNVYAYQSL